MSVGSFNTDRTTELMSRFTNDTEVVTHGIMQLLAKAIREPLKMATCLIAAAFISALSTNLLSDYRPHCRRAHGLPIESLATVQS